MPLAPNVPTFGKMEGFAHTNARRQSRNQRWTCDKRHTVVTNAQCRAAHAAGEHRACRECSIPGVLPKVGA